MDLKIKCLSPLLGKAVSKPSYGSLGAAGIDLCACITEPVTLKPGDSTVIPTGIAIEIPSPDLAVFVYARSGLGIKHNICLSNGVGVIDSDYRGEIKVGLINQGKKDYVIEVGERIAQMIVSPVCHVNLTETDMLSETERGQGGFGSTGRI